MQLALPLCIAQGNDQDDHCRFHKLAQGADVLSVRQFELIPELAGNPFLPRLFAMFDTDKDGKLTQVHRLKDACMHVTTSVSEYTSL